MRHFAFEPVEDFKDNHSDIVVIPNQDMEQITFYLTTMLSDFAISLMRQFEQTARDIATMEEIPSPRNFDTSLSRDVQNRIHLRYAGRRLKLMGDLYLMSSAYNEAVTSYIGASEETKAAGDHLWHSSAQEGLQISLCLQQNNSLLLTDNLDPALRRELWASLAQRLKEVAILYDRTVMPRLSFQVQSQISELYMLLGDVGQAADALSQGWNSCRPLIVYEKLVVLADLIRRFEAFGLQRKAAFYRKRLVFHLTNLDESQVASKIMTPVIAQYSRASWDVIRRAVLDQAMDLAKSCHDYKGFVELALMQLCSSRDFLSTTEQERLKKSIKEYSAKLRGLGKISVCQNCVDVQVKALATETLKVVSSPKLRSTSPLMYTPQTRTRNQREKPEKLISIINEPIKVLVTLSNPFCFRLSLHNLRLGSGDSINLTLEPLEKAKTVTLFASPESLGDFVVDQLNYDIFGTFCIHYRFTPIIYNIWPAQPLLKAIKIPDHFELFSGESKTIEIEIRNLGTVRSKISKIDSDFRVLSKPAFIEPECNETIQLELAGNHPSSKLIVEYGGEHSPDSAYLTRALEIPIKISQRPALKIVDLAILPFSEDVTHGKGHEKLQAPTMTFTDQSFDNLNEAKLSCDGKESRSCRDLCWVVADIDNESDISMMVRVTKDSEAVRIPANSLRRIVFPLQRLVASSDESKLTDTQRIALRRENDEPPSPTDIEAVLLKQNLVDSLKISWLSSDNRTGIVDLESVELADTSLWYLKRSELEMDVSFRTESKDWESVPGLTFSAPAAEWIDIRLLLTSSSNSGHLIKFKPLISGWTEDVCQLIAIDGCLGGLFYFGSSECRFRLKSAVSTTLQLKSSMLGAAEDEGPIITIHFQ